VAYRDIEKTKDKDEILYGSDLKIGESVIVDKGKPNSSIVKIVEFSPKRMFTMVINSDGLSWTIMTKRLTKKHEKT